MLGPKCLKRDSSGKNVLLSCYQCVFHLTEANLAATQLQNHQNVTKKQFWQKVPGKPKSVASVIYLDVVNNYTVIQHVKQILHDFVVSAVSSQNLRPKMCKISSAIFANGFAVLFSAVALPVLNQ